MRPADHKHVRQAATLDALNAASAAVGTGDEIAWDDYLQQNVAEAGQLRTGLWAVGCMKCWFSEAVLQQGEGHIEHFRPKGKLSGAAHNGYKWRTFDWKNLRLAHATVNLRRTDYLTKKKMGKGSYFPLQNPENRATSATEEVNETPLLLDPVVPSDTLLICFDETSGAPKPRFKEDQNKWLYDRADQSIDYYHLDEGTWNAKRADLMGEIRELCNQLEELAIAQPKDEAAYNSKIDEIVAYISPFAEFSSACLQVVREKGLLDHFAPGL